MTHGENSFPDSGPELPQIEGVNRETSMDTMTLENFRKMALVLGACSIAMVLINTQGIIKDIANSDQAGRLFDLLDTNRPGKWLIRRGQKIHELFELSDHKDDREEAAIVQIDHLPLSD